MDKILYKEKKIPNLGIILSYYFLVDTCQTDDLPIAMETYGIEIEKRYDYEGVMYVQSKVANEISCSERHMLYLLELLYQCSVTPVTLLDVIADLEEEGFFTRENECYSA